MLPVQATISKAGVRAKCRAKWGGKWWDVHPVIKKARLAWASGVVLDQSVVVHEGDCSYVV